MDAIRSRMLEPDAPVVLLKDACKTLLRSKGLMVKKRIPSRWIGVHPGNRYGDGVLPADVIALNGDIFGQGFSAFALQDPTMMQVPPQSHSRRSQFISSNVSIAQGSGGQLPDYEDDIESVTVTRGHTSMGFRCWGAGSPCDDERFCQNRRLSLRRIQETQPTYADAVVHGLEWDLIL